MTVQLKLETARMILNKKRCYQELIVIPLEQFDPNVQTTTDLVSIIYEGLFSCMNSDFIDGNVFCFVQNFCEWLLPCRYPKPVMFEKVWDMILDPLEPTAIQKFELFNEIKHEDVKVEEFYEKAKKILSKNIEEDLSTRFSFFSIDLY